MENTISVAPFYRIAEIVHEYTVVMFVTDKTTADFVLSKENCQILYFI